MAALAEYTVLGGPFDGGYINPEFVDARLKRNLISRTIALPLIRKKTGVTIDSKPEIAWSLAPNDDAAELMAAYRVEGNVLLHSHLK